MTLPTPEMKAAADIVAKIKDPIRECMRRWPSFAFTISTDRNPMGRAVGVHVVGKWVADDLAPRGLAIKIQEAGTVLHNIAARIEEAKRSIAIQALVNHEARKAQLRRGPRVV